MADLRRSRTSVRSAVIWQVLQDALGELAADRLEVLDAGGGSGGFAVPLAQLGHRVTVVDPSPDSLAALERRAAEAGVSALVDGRQGDAAGLLEVVAPDSCDMVLCHSVLEVVDDPAEALTAVARVVRAGGMVSVLVANRVSAVVGRVLAGRLGEAGSVLTDPAGRFGDQDPLARRFSLAELTALVTGAGLRPGPAHGIRVFADLVPGSLLDADPDVLDQLVDLEQRVAEVPPYRDLATQLHLLARAG